MNKEILIELGLHEDIREGDITTQCIIPDNKLIKAQIRAKQDGILCGIDIAKYVLFKYDKNVKFIKKFDDGEKIKEGDILAIIQGKASSIITCERLMLNFLQVLSGIATTANKYVQKVKKYNVQVLDTRKTIPGYRELQKYAVKTGEAINHRHGLYDMVLIKDNHIKAAGSIEKALGLVKNNEEFKKLRKIKHLKIEIEVENIAEVKKVLANDGIDMIMLDNFSLSDTLKAVEIIRKKNKVIKIESSGGINLQNIEDYAKTGVDFISIGTALTISPQTLDITVDILN